MPITPSDSCLYPDYDWLIGNHSDELTPWIPVIAARYVRYVYYIENFDWILSIIKEMSDIFLAFWKYFGCQLYFNTIFDNFLSVLPQSRHPV